MSTETVEWVGVTFRPDPIPRIQEAYVSSIEGQLAATLLVVAATVLLLVGTRRVQSIVDRRYGRLIAEAGAVAAMLVVVVASVYALTVVWRVTFVLRQMVATVALDRWTAARHLVTVGVIAVAYLSIRFVNRSIDKLSQTNAVTKHQSEVAYHVADVAIVLAAGTVLLTVWGVDLTNIFIGAGAIVAIVAVTARETLRAMLAGFILLFSRPFRVGDWVEVGGRSGIVTDVTIFNTTLQTFGDASVLVPNDEITSSHITNFSKNDQLRVELEVGIDYDTDVARARSVVTDAVDDLESVKRTPTPQVVARRFGESSIVLEVQLWIGDPTMRRKLNARTEAIQAIQRAFEREGIEIPYPQRVHSSRDETGFRVSGSTLQNPDLADADD